VFVPAAGRAVLGRRGARGFGVGHGFGVVRVVGRERGFAPTGDGERRGAWGWARVETAVEEPVFAMNQGFEVDCCRRTKYSEEIASPGARCVFVGADP
jgi:hypothetical protein